MLEGITIATVIALGGFVVNLIFNTTNFVSNKRTGRKAAELAAFNAHVRTPIGAALTSLDAIMDSADDIALSRDALDVKLTAIQDLSKKFHATRRVIARHLNDCDISAIIKGTDWAQCDEGYMDAATDALSAASACEFDADIRGRLLDFATAINSLRTELIAKLDAEAKRLMH